MSRILISGTGGFAGSHIARWFMERGHKVVALDCLTYAAELERSCGRFVWWDLAKPLTDDVLKEIGPVDWIVSNAAESHVSRAFTDPKRFIDSNIFGTLHMLEAARKLKPSKFIAVSTDEVFGSRTTPAYPGDALAPSNPYAASKAGGEYLSRAYWRSFGVPVVITRSPNLFGIYQNWEKFIPLLVFLMKKFGVVQIHTGKDGKPGSRRWLYVEKQAEAIEWLCDNGDPGKTYHVAEGTLRNNAEIAESVAEIIGEKPEFHPLPSGRLTYDDSYWTKPAEGDPRWEDDEFEKHFEETVRWYRDFGK